jgi:hypothetical protein
LNTNQSPDGLVPQRNERPLNFPSDFWKGQLATKYLEIAGKGDIEALQQLLNWIMGRW